MQISKSINRSVVSNVVDALVWNVSRYLSHHVHQCDQTLHRHNHSGRHLSRYLIHCIEEWANTWQLLLSVEKCCIFEINKKHSTSSFCLNGVSLPTTNIVKDLGITVNDSLTPCTHIAKITATAHQRVNLRSFTSRDISMLLRAYTTYVIYQTLTWI